jgi:ACS family hexuronate transporter-like MFS transporter
MVGPKDPVSPLRWGICFMLFLATTINYMDRTVLGLLKPQIQAGLGWTELDYANVVTCFTFAYAIGYVTSGRLIDRVGTKIGYAIAIVVWGLSSIGHAFVQGIIGFCIARFCLGLAESGNFPAAMKATTEWFPSEERALATGLFNSGTNLAAMGAPIYIYFAIRIYKNYLIAHQYNAIYVEQHYWRAGFVATGSLGLIWVVLWLLLPYNRLRRRLTTTQVKLALPITKAKGEIRLLLTNRGTWAFAVGKALTDPIWWFYLFWLPGFFVKRFNLSMGQLAMPLVIVYTGSAVGSIAGGWLSGFWIKRGRSVNYGRKFALLVCAIAVTPVIFVANSKNIWQAIALLALATAAHQGWSANLFSTPTDMFPSTSVSTVVGIGGTVGAIGGVLFQQLTGRLLDWTHGNYFPLFAMAALAYLTALFIINRLVPQLGVKKEQTA